MPTKLKKNDTRTRKAPKVEPDSLESGLTKNGSNGTPRYERPHLIPGETPEEREKRLKERDALTLRVFRMAYENHHHLKDS